MDQKTILKWEEIKLSGDSFTPRFGHGLILYKQDLFLFGGIDSLGKRHDFFRINISQAPFQSSPISLKGEGPSLRFGFQCCYYQSGFWLHGGNTSMDGIYFNDLFRLDLDTFEWAKIEAENPHCGRIHHTFLPFQNYGVILGGLEGRTPLRDLLLIDFSGKKWIQAEKPPKGIFGHSANVFGKEMIVFGGCDGRMLLKDLRIFDFETMSWKESACKGKINPLFRHSSEVFKEFLIVYGGMLDQQSYNPEIYCLELKKLVWSTILFHGYQPKSRNFHQSIIINDTFYILGGYGGVFLNDVHCFKLPLSLQNSLEPTAKVQKAISFEVREEDTLNQLEWFKTEAKGPIPSPRTGHAFFALKGILYIFAGSGTDQLTNDLFSYDPKSHVFTQIPIKSSFPTPRSGAKAVSNGSHAFLFGGYLNKNTEFFNELFKFDPIDQNFLKLQLTGDVLDPLVDHSMVLYDKYLYIYGGKTPKYLSNSLFRLNLEKNQVTNLKYSGDIPTPRIGHSADVYKANMFVFGGWNGQETVDELFYFSLISNIWYEVRLLCGVKPKGRYRHSSLIFERSLFIFGGVDQKQHKFNDLHEFRLEKNEWRSVEVRGLIMPSPRSFHQTLCLENRMFLFGGTDDKKLNDFYLMVLPSKGAGFEAIPDKGPKSVSLFEDEKEKLNFMEGMDQGNRLIGLLKEQVKELTTKLKVEQERHLCKVCFDREINCVVLECGHKFSCFDCSGKYEKCIICKKLCMKKVRVFTI